MLMEIYLQDFLTAEAKRMAKKILIVDDDPDFTTSTSGILEAEGFSVISASNGKEGFVKGKEENPDAILLDVMIEDAGAGLDIARRLRDDQKTARIPVILLTGIRRADQLLESYAPGEKWPNVKAALEKPVNPDYLIKTLKNAIG